MRLVTFEVERGGTTHKEYGFPIVWEPYAHVKVGHPNRMGLHRRLGLGIDFARSLAGQKVVERGSFMRTTKGTLLLIEEHPDPKPRIGLLLYAHPGTRGESQIEVDDVLLRGQIWSSPKGNLGIGEVVLMIAYPGNRFRIHRTGNLWEAPEYIWVQIGDDLMIHTFSQEEADEAKEITEAEKSNEVL